MLLANKLKRINNQLAAGGEKGVLGSVSIKESLLLGESFVGSVYRMMTSGKGLVSADGLRTFRFAERKSGVDQFGEPWSKTGSVVNFELK